eukprot:TRINITY_DN13307_c0_g1_i1.p1 TRINITY_DN13307_c0_g1~~TRINITY_DN13307_c0_g1_i1.p1  ORF type:complete len:126 (+),score=21.66 TRINITY_DN13307_c0_g1_i1:65-442(+)
MCIRDRYQRRVHGVPNLITIGFDYYNPPSPRKEEVGLKIPSIVQMPTESIKNITSPVQYKVHLAILHVDKMDYTDAYVTCVPSKDESSWVTFQDYKVELEKSTANILEPSYPKTVHLILLRKVDS